MTDENTEPTPPGADRVGFVDVHAHFLTAHYRTKAEQAGHNYPDGMPGWPEWSLERHLENMGKNGIDKAILSISSPGVHIPDSRSETVRLAQYVNDEAAEIHRQRPEQFNQFVNLPLPHPDESIAELDRALRDLDAAGVIIESNIAGAYLGHPDFAPVLAALNEWQVATLIHPTSPACFPQLTEPQPRPLFEFPFESARTITDLIMTGTLQKYPQIRFIIPHCGGALPYLIDRLELFRGAFAGMENPDTQRLLRGLWFDLAGTPFPRQAPFLADLVGTDRIVYGSDYCWTPDSAVDTQIASIDTAVAPQNAPDWRTLTTQNARRLLARP